jgi:endonuclease YncB( thermonuclease family)
VDSTAPNIGREFGTVYVGDKNVAYLIVAAGWARVTTIYFFLNCLIVLKFWVIFNLICLFR